MYPDHLPKAQKANYTNDDVFRARGGLVRGFVEKNYARGMHVQEFVEINVITRGAGMHYIETRRLAAECGDVFIIPAGVSHGYEGGDGFDVCHILLSNTFMEKYLADLQTLPSFFVLFQAEPLLRASNSDPFHLTLHPDQLGQLTVLTDALGACTPPASAADILRANSLTLLSITLLCECYTANTEADVGRAVPYDKAFMNALSLIHERYYEKISIARLARTAQLSRSAFLRRFQEVCRMPPAKYLLKRRTEAARHMLLSTALSLSEIASRTGFCDASHLVRTFTAETGLSPSQYRKSGKP